MGIEEELEESRAQPPIGPLNGAEDGVRLTSARLSASNDCCTQAGHPPLKDAPPKTIEEQ